jgi:hypothetical protein
MSYEPNWQHSRVRARTIKALAFVEQYTRSTRVDWLSIKEIYKHFGNTSRDLGRYLKEQLLEEADSYYNMTTGVCKKYRLNKQGHDRVRSCIGLEPTEPVVSDKIVEQVQSGQFLYQERSDRHYTAAQFIPKERRHTLLENHGYRYHYDIEAAAPTVLAQQAQLLKPKLKIPTLLLLISDRKSMRQQIAQESSVTEAKIKIAVNSILHGGILSRRLGNKTYMNLNYDSDAVIRLNNSPTMRLLKKDIAKMWQVLKPEMTPISGRITPRDKASLYRSYENQIGKEIKKILARTKQRYLWIHDGWASDTCIDPIEIETRVRQLTGFKIKLDLEICEE